MRASKAGEVRLKKPFAYQEVDGGKQTVAANYVIRRDGGVAFRLGKYDPSHTLIIDPILSYSTYLGGSNIDGANAIAVAPDKTAFITGGTYSLRFSDGCILSSRTTAAPMIFSEMFCQPN